MWLLAMLPTAQAVDPLVISVAEPNVTEIVLTCGDKTYRSEVTAGRASFQFRPEGCQVSLLTRTGTIDGPGQYACDRRGCTEYDVVHQTITTAEGRLTVVLTDESTTILELKCPTSNYRQRSNVVTNTAVFEGVPNEECDLHWKGGSTPAKAFRLTSGTYYCSTNGGTGVCKRK